MKEHFLQANEATLWVAEQGEGFPVVLISGGPGCCDYLEPVASLIDDVVHTIRFDARGCGRSSLTPPYDLQTAIADLDELRKMLDFEQWVVLGHSWGANVALAYALTHPICTSGVIYLSGRGLQNDQDWKDAYRRRRDAGEDQTPEFAYPPNLEVNEVCNLSWKAFIKQPTLWKQISMLAAPMLAVVGSKDIRPSWPVEQVTHLMPFACFERIEGAGHCLWLTHSRQLGLLLHHFLEKL
ncbi:alpha/beta fold hydrolase [Fischerella sp. PCC 9605]|uniref:alpha/beta fold hydrolase n=1 Tax=Fischerella sp. PCC 9605 TaxID=1173024 RepID=UPI00047CA2C2|nr:alpha/beta hydrolase [Fischerella sp. PCC 9605]